MRSLPFTVLTRSTEKAGRDNRRSHCMKRRRRNLWRRALPIGLLTMFVAAVVVCQIFVRPRVALLPPLREGTVEVHVIDVGQAACTLIRTEDGCILIDAGVEAVGEKVVR